MESQVQGNQVQQSAADGGRLLYESCLTLYFEVAKHPLPVTPRMALDDVGGVLRLRERQTAYQWIDENEEEAMRLLGEHVPYEIAFLSDYGDEGIRVFSGEERGRLVAEAILEKHGADVRVYVADHILTATSSFRRAFGAILPDCLPDRLAP